MAVSEFRCERADLFDKLKSADWFENFIRHQYSNVVFHMESVAPVFSDYWIRHAHFRWNKDIRYVSDKEYDGRSLDHFKYSGFLCYWLRRCPPIADLCWNTDTKFAGIIRRDPPRLLIQYGNVFSAFDIGLRICRYWESARTDIPYTRDVREKIRDFSIPSHSEFIEDMCYTLAEKNISPHSLNMLYKGLFVGFRPAN